jgi:hypothetical protein
MATMHGAAGVPPTGISASPSASHLFASQHVHERVGSCQVYEWHRLKLASPDWGDTHLCELSLGLTIVTDAPFRADCLA